MFTKLLVPLSNQRNELHTNRNRSCIYNTTHVTTDEIWVNFIMVQEWQTSRKNILKKLGASPYLFYLIEFCFKHPLKIFLLKESLYVKTFLLKVVKLLHNSFDYFYCIWKASGGSVTTSYLRKSNLFVWGVLGFGKNTTDGELRIAV